MSLPSSSRGLLLVVAAVFVPLGLVTLTGLGHPFGNGDEVIYAQNVREMRQTGELAFLTWQGEWVLQRPAAPFVAAAAGEAIVGGERGLRLPSALASLLTLGLLFAIAWRLWRRLDVAATAALLCAGAPTFHLFGRALLSDPLLVLALTVALAGTIAAQRDPRGLVLAGAGLGAAFALKSFAAGIPMVALAPWLVVAGLRHRRWRPPLYAAAAFVALAAPFFVLGALRFGGDFWREHVMYSLVSRARGELLEGHLGMPGAGAYVRYLIETDGLAVTAWLVLGSAGAAAWALRTKDAALGILGSYVLVVTLGLSLVDSRLAHYLLPIYPAAALGAAGLYARASDDRLPWRHRWVVPALAVTLLAVGLTRTPDHYFLPSPETKRLGLAARVEAGPTEPVYTLEWYAPAFAYYAERPLHMLTASPTMYAVVDGVDFFHKANVAQRTPPNVPPDAVLLVAAPATALAGHRWLVVERVVAREEPYVLVRGRVVPTP